MINRFILIGFCFFAMPTLAANEQLQNSFEKISQDAKALSQTIGEESKKISENIRQKIDKETQSVSKDVTSTKDTWSKRVNEAVSELETGLKKAWARLQGEFN